MLPMVIAGGRELTATGCLIVMDNGCGFLRPDGHGLRKSRGAGRLIITGDGSIRLRLAGYGLPDSARVIGIIITRIFAGVRRWFSSSMPLLRAATMSAGIR